MDNKTPYEVIKEVSKPIIDKAKKPVIDINFPYTDEDLDMKKKKDPSQYLILIEALKKAGKLNPDNTIKAK